MTNQLLIMYMNIKTVYLILMILCFSTIASAQDIMTEFGKVSGFFKPDLRGDVLRIEEKDYLVFDTSRYSMDQIEEAYSNADSSAFEEVNRNEYVFVGDVSSITSEANLTTKPLYRTTFYFPTPYELHEVNYHRGNVPMFAQGDVYHYNKEGWCTSAKYNEDNVYFEYENTIKDNLLVSRKGTMSFIAKDTGKLIELSSDSDFEWFKPNSRFNVTSRIQNKIQQVEKVLIKEEDVYKVRYFWRGDLTHTLDRNGNVLEFKFYKQGNFLRELTILEDSVLTDEVGNWVMRKKVIRDVGSNFDHVYIRKITYR